MKFRYVTAKDAVYWIEEDYDPNVGKLIPTIKVGYYLSSYKTQLGIKHLISNGEITSCVVRHIDDGNMYNSYIEAQRCLENERQKNDDRRIERRSEKARL